MTHSLAYAHTFSEVTDVGWLHQIENPTVADLGGKAMNLHRLAMAGMPVPAAFVISSKVFFDTLEALGHQALCGPEATSYLSALSRRWQISDEKDVLRRIQDKLIAAPFPEGIVDAVTTLFEQIHPFAASCVAVRSSAVDEDGAGASFAGQYDTVLNVKDKAALLHAIKTCWASALSHRAWLYRKEKKQNQAEVAGIAIIVQQMVDSEVSGVAFTSNPMGSRSQTMLIEASWGLGEGIVDGKVTTDSFTLDRTGEQVLDRNIRYKLLSCTPSQSARTELTELPEHKRNIQSLSDDKLLELAGHCVRIREYFRTEQDVEWALQDNSIYILQARPITTLSQSSNSIIDLDPDESDDYVRKNTLWSMVDVGEATVGIMTPLGQTFMYYYRDNIHAKGIRACGAWDPGESHRYLGFIHGRCYMNISNLAHTFSQEWLHKDQGKLTLRYLNEDVKKEDYHTPFPTAATGFQLWLRTAYYLYQQWRGVRWRWARKRAHNRRCETYDYLRGKDLSSFSTVEFSEEIRKREKQLLDSMINYFPFYLLSMAGHDMLTAFSRRFLGEERLEDVLKTDMSELRTIDVTEDLWRVCMLMEDHKKVKEIVLRNPSDQVKGLIIADPEGQAFWQRHIDPLLRKHGVRGQPPEFDLSVDRWVDNPTLLFSMAKNYLTNRFDLIEVAEKAAGKREVTKQRALSRLTKPQRWVMERLINLYFTVAETRELTRMWMLTETWAIQRMVREAMRRLVAAGVLYDEKDIAYVDFRDLLDYGLGKVGEGAFSQEKVEACRREHQYNMRVVDPPMTQIGPYDPSARVQPKGADGMVTGLGTSPGCVSGKARIIIDVHRQAGEFRPGEVLVTHFTNAAWTPLFVSAAAVVTDLGSMLAHSSVVAREYGIPAVVNTKVATRSFKTGDEIVVDGNTGRVFLKQTP